MRLAKIFILSIMIAVGWVNWKLFDSMRYQAFLSYEFNAGKLLAPVEIFDRFDNNFPNLNQSALPISYIKGRYYQANDSLEAAISLYHNSLKINPYLMAAEAALAEIYLKKDVLDSAYYYSNKAFYNHPNVGIHRRVYFDVLKRINDSTELSRAFNLLKNTNKISHWMDYIATSIQFMDNKNPVIINAINEFEERFPETEDLDIFKKIVDIGETNIILSVTLSEEGSRLFQEKRYNESLKYYQLAIELDNTDYSFYENLALSYFMLNEYEKALENFDLVTEKFKINDGKSYYYKGFIFLEQDKKEQGCENIRQAIQLGFNNSISNQTYNFYCN